MEGSARIACMLEAEGIFISLSKASRFSCERLYPATIFSLSDLAAARVSTLAQRPRPTIATLMGTELTITSKGIRVGLGWAVEEVA